MKHKHADLMAAYAADAQNTDKPWELWEINTERPANWRTLSACPMWLEGNQYRRKPNPTPIPYTVSCVMPIKAISPEEAAWQMRELLASGLGLIVVTDEDGLQHAKLGVRPKGV